LTGAPTENYLHKTTANIIDLIYEGDQKSYIMCAGSNSVPNKWEDISSVGIVSSHAYTVLSCFLIKSNGVRLRLVRLRNPWGQTEWNGDWSDKSKLWTPELKAQVGFVDKADGIFFMSEMDYLRYFSITTICKYTDGHDNTVA